MDEGEVLFLVRIGGGRFDRLQAPAENSSVQFNLLEVLSAPTAAAWRAGQELAGFLR